MRLDVLELEIRALRAEDDAAGGDGHVRHRVLAVVAEAGSLDGRDLRRKGRKVINCFDEEFRYSEMFNNSNLKADLEPVDYEGRQGLSINVLGHDDQRTLGLEYKMIPVSVSGKQRGDVCET